MKQVMSTLLLVLCTTVAWAQSEVRGTVKDQSTGQTIAGATVLLSNPDLRKGIQTDANGQFLIDAVPSGTYQLKVSFVGYVSFEESVEINADRIFDIQLVEKVVGLDDVIVTGTRANEKSPTTYQNVSKEAIQKQNLGQDLPVLLNFTPSVVTTSDAGAGIGYTGIRIRGSDPTRINVTINGIPLNDPESQGVFWVNMPDFSSSVSDIQIQRGVGTSTNGAGAFGASLNILTDGISSEAGGQINVGGGSFNTRRVNGIFSTGLLSNNFAFKARLSQIKSDGYIDRAFSDLNSWYAAGGYYGRKSTVKLITFSGNEQTYQSWWGTPEARLNNDVAGMQEVIANNGYSQEQAVNLLNSGRTFNYYLYDNQIDNYGQDHYQLHFSHTFDASLSLNTAIHYTRGQGYFEEFREDDDFADYGLPDLNIGGQTISSTDLIRRRWLDNDFYGGTFDLNYSSDKVLATWGGAINRYDGDHFGEIIWAAFAGDTEIRDRWYESTSEKTDMNTYFKLNYQLSEKLNVYGDLQLRQVDYTGFGNDNDLRPIDFDESWTFFNPKFGAIYQADPSTQFYASFAVGNKEPNRSDIIDAPPGTSPTHETLNNLEVGLRKQVDELAFELNYYYMDYNNQLVLTGDVNDVGATIRTNVPNSYRMGLEASANWNISNSLNWNVNATISENKIRSFEEVIIDYGVNFDEFNLIRNQYENTNISFSPNLIMGSQLSFRPIDAFEVALLSKYVGDQYLDNTSNDDRKIDAFFTNDIRVNYDIPVKGLKAMNISLLVNNVLNEMYESNGYTFGYFGGTDFEVRENYFYPQAGTNFLLSLGLKF